MLWFLKICVNRIEIVEIASTTLQHDCTVTRNRFDHISSTSQSLSCHNRLNRIDRTSPLLFWLTILSFGITALLQLTIYCSAFLRFGLTIFSFGINALLQFTIYCAAFLRFGLTMLSFGITALLQLCLVRMHRRRKAPYANLVYIYIYIYICICIVR